MRIAVLREPPVAAGRGKKNSFNLDGYAGLMPQCFGPLSELATA